MSPDWNPTDIVSAFLSVLPFGPVKVSWRTESMCWLMAAHRTS